MGIALLRVVVHVHSLHHKRKYGQTTPTASRIEMEMMTYLLFRRVAPPELGNSHRAHTIEKGILQQFGGTALPCP